MDRKEVKSSQIKSIGYDPDSKIMEVEFHSWDKAKPTSVYQYRNVEEHHYLGLYNAESIGSHFGKHFRPNAERFPFTKISPASEAGKP